MLSELASIKIGLIAAEVSSRNQVNDDHDVLGQLADLKTALSSLRSNVCGKLKMLTLAVQSARLPPYYELWRLLGSCLLQG